MGTILINGISAKTGGGKAILTNYLKLLNQNKLKHSYIIIAPSKSYAQKHKNNRIAFIVPPMLFRIQFIFPLTYLFYLPRIIKKYHADVVFNLADIPVPTKAKQIFLFDWAYAVYPESSIWKNMGFKDLLVRKTKVWFFKQFKTYIDFTIAQTKNIKNRLQLVYEIKNIEVIPNAVSLENMARNPSRAKNFNLPNGFKALCLTYYYPHKNLEILLKVAEEIKKAQLDYKIVLTIEEGQHPDAAKLLHSISDAKLEDVIINIGPVDMKHVPDLYNQCDALLMPTLLESYGLTYVEAFFNEKLIFTSNLDFAQDVCQDAAVYFDPYDHKSIFDSLVATVGDEELKSLLIENGKSLLGKLNSWDEVFSKYNRIIDNYLN